MIRTINNRRLLSNVTLIAAILALMVIGLGAYTRLKDAGLGCPDWPGCYGHFTVPGALSGTLQIHKAWAEMIHRYFAGTVALLGLFAAVLSTITAVKSGMRFLFLGILLLAFVIYQPLLGMWTVTLKLLPFIVTLHLLGGMSLLALLWLTHLAAKNRDHQTPSKNLIAHIKPWALLGLIFVFLQIFLGAWTSTNYASLSCPDFPWCNHLPWQLQFHQAFNLFSPLGINYEGGVLNQAARMTIQTVHRFGALFVSSYLLVLILYIFFTTKQQNLQKSALSILLILGMQISLGISNVLFKLPLAIAIAHNLFAALLLLALVTLNFYLFSNEAHIND